MRIVGGQFAGRTLVAPAGLATRPTSDKVRQALFNILFSRGAAMDRVLDLFAGSGALGFEALSRGATELHCVEFERNALVAIDKNAATLGVTGQVRVHREKIAAWAKRQRSSDTRFDLVFIDPPYDDKGAQKTALRAAVAVLADGGLVVLEHDRMDKVPDVIGDSEAGPTLHRVDQREYGQTAVSFYQSERSEQSDSQAKGTTDG